MIRGILAILAIGALGSGSLGSGSMGGGSMGMGPVMAGPVAGCGAPGADYDARDYALSDLTSVKPTNSGSFGSGWDLDHATPGGLNYRVSANCNGGGNPCFAGASGVYASMSAADTGQTWTKTIVCGVVYAASADADRFVAWDDTSLSFLEFNVTSGWRLRSQTYEVIANNTYSDGWHSICWDMTDPSNVSASVDGTTTASGVDIDGAGGYYLDPQQVSLASIWSTSGYMSSGKIGRVAFYNDDPGMTLDELSSCLGSDWGLL